MEKHFYLQVSQEDEHGWMRNFYPCPSREAAEKSFKVIVERYKESVKDNLGEFDFDEDEPDNFYSYCIPHFDNFHVEIIEELEKTTDYIIEELEADGFFG
jgi:hypothetical protein